MKILVVDDKKEHQLVLETKLTAAGYEVDCATNGIEGLQKLRGGGFGLVITDLMMSEMDGYQLTHAIKTDEKLKDIPVLVYTATYTDPKDEALALTLGANGFILKPATDQDFFTEVNRLVGEAASGKLPKRTPTNEELTYLRQYNERLVKKLQDKVAELAGAQEKLRDANTTLELRVQRATAELRHANEELEAFAYSVSHDLRAPLRSIEGLVTASMTNSPPMEGEQRAQLLQRAASLAVQGQDLINDLLEYARLKSAEVPLTAVSVGLAVQNALERIEPDTLAEAEMDLGPFSSRVLANELVLGHAIWNLISNALKFVKPGVKPRVSISELEENGWIRISVSDNGIGIPSEQRERIFKVFERLHDTRAHPGTGVGLAIVQRAVQKMRGHVGVDDNPGGGSTFWIELPKAG